jgi:predicted methyltransferase
LTDFSSAAQTPSYAKKEIDRARCLAIGESDRMTLKFVKL